jgi:hypothetical protein
VRVSFPLVPAPTNRPEIPALPVRLPKLPAALIRPEIRPLPVPSTLLQQHRWQVPGHMHRAAAHPCASRPHPDPTILTSSKSSNNKRDDCIWWQGFRKGIGVGQCFRLKPKTLTNTNLSEKVAVCRNSQVTASHVGVGIAYLSLYLNVLS